MTEEEKKAIESFKKENDNDLSRFEYFNTHTQFLIKRNTTLLNLISKLQEKDIALKTCENSLIKERQERIKLDKVIDKMAKVIDNGYRNERLINNLMEKRVCEVLMKQSERKCKGFDCGKCIKQYFYGKVEKDD